MNEHIKLYPSNWLYNASVSGCKTGIKTEINADHARK